MHPRRAASCKFAILACVHASVSQQDAPPATAPPHASSAEHVAEQLLALWRGIARDGGVATYAILEELDLTLTHVKALCALAERELTVKDLAERLGLSLPGTSRAVDALVARGLLGRREDAADRRMKRLRCTDAGRRILEQIDDARLSGLKTFAATLSPENRERLSTALGPILDDLPTQRP